MYVHKQRLYRHLYLEQLRDKADYGGAALFTGMFPAIAVHFHGKPIYVSGHTSL